MKAIEPTLAPEKFLCSKGLARTGALLEYMAENTDHRLHLGENSPAARVLRQDEITIRQAFNHRYQSLNEYADLAGREAAELERREILLYLFRLYAAGRRQTPAEFQRPLQPAEVDGVLSTLRRFSITSRPALEHLVSECERQAEADTDVLAHVMDPLQVRYLLSCGAGEAEQQLGAARVRVLQDACARKDRGAIQAWFDALIPHLPILSKHVPQFLRSVILAVWREGGSGLEALAFETSTLDVRLYADLGFESTRLFCSVLRRITAPGCEVLDAYLNDEEIDAALLSVEAIHQVELAAHFRKLAATYSTQNHRQLQRRVEAAAAPKSAEPESDFSPAADTPATSRPWSRLLGLSAHAT